MAAKKRSPKKKATKKKPPETPSPPQEESLPDRQAEPEGGPGAREREFLEERMTRLAPKGEPPPAPPPGAAEPGAPAEEGILPPDFRRQLIEEYRRKQRAAAVPAVPEAAPPEEGAPPPPPEPPSPPPTNNWVPIGPSVLRQGQGEVKPPTSGRTPAIAVAPGGNRVYIGSANGGVWRSDDAGVTWRSLMDAFDLNPTTPASDSLSVGAIAIDNANPERVFVGSGEGAGGAYFGVGPILTNNGGANPPAWTTEQAAAGSLSLAGTAFYALAIDPTNADRVIAATRRGLYRREPNPAGGFHWVQKTSNGISNNWVTSVIAASSGGATTFYAARWDGPVFSSTDGHTWTQIGTGFPGAVGRVALACQRDNPSVVYALTRSGSVFRLNTAEGVWRNVTGVPAGFTGTQGNYDLAISVAPDNVNRIYIGGSTVWTGSDWSGSLYRCEITAGASSASMTATSIGASVHADIHTIVFAPGDATRLWVGCDGGVFYSTNPTGSGNIFVSRNLGLQTLTMEYLAQHPTEDAVLFCGTQDNGCVRYTGEEAWLYSAGGDGGFEVINWNDPYRVLSSYVFGCIRRSTNGGQRYSYFNVNVPMVNAQCSPTEGCLFYAPLAGTPPNQGSPTAAADADLVAFGSIRPWISTNFGTSWQSIPNNTLAGDSLDGNIRSLTFASPNRLYAGTMAGGVYRFDRGAGGVWTRTQIDTMGGTNQLPLAGPITDIAVDPTNADRVYITFGGTGDWRHVWFFDGTQWMARSGTAAGNIDSLLDVHANALVIDPANPTHLYLGADIGIWHSTSSGLTWQTYSQGLPDVAVTDLMLHNPRRVLRAATHGRSVWERTIPDTPKQGIELYVRSTQLDLGRIPAANDLPDPTAPGQLVKFWRGPDIKLDTPNAMGQYQVPLTGTIDFHQFVDTLTDDFQNVATHATANIITRVFVQVHNRGVLQADNVRVMLLLANASAGLPALPSGYEVNVRNGMPINNANWRTVGIETLSDVRVGFPKIAAFNLPSSFLPPPANLAGNQHQCVLALVHHADDQFTNTQTHVDTLSQEDRKAAHKNLTVVQFTGTLPPPMPVFLAFRIHNADVEKQLHSGLLIHLFGYPGRVRLLLPKLEIDGLLEGMIEGMRIIDIEDDVRKWADQYITAIKRSYRRRRRFHWLWSRQRIEDVSRALESGVLLQAEDNKRLEIHGILMQPDSYHTLFLAFDRPEDAMPGESYEVEIQQIDEKRRAVLGGLSARVELVPKPEQ